MAAHAAASGPSPPWYAHAVLADRSTTGAPAASAPATIASACSSRITLNAPTARPAAQRRPGHLAHPHRGHQPSATWVTATPASAAA